MIINANALHIPLADKSVQCIVTSPPYWGLRNYGISGQLGLERTPEEYITNMVAVFRECWRVLRDDGTLWLNCGDSYATQPAGNKTWGNGVGSNKHYQEDSIHRKERNNFDGLKPKDLVGIPWRLAFALQADGWYLRSDIIWSKPNPMPESVTDRPTKSHEYLFLLAKQERYYYDQEAIREDGTGRNWLESGGNLVGSGIHKANDGYRDNGDGRHGEAYGRNRRTVWTIPTAPYKGAHFATFPPALVEPCIKAGTSERGACPKCGKGWRRVIDRTPPGRHESEHQTIASGRGNGGDKSKHATPSVNNTLGWRPDCKHYGLEIIKDQPNEPHPKKHESAKEFEARYNKWKIELNEWSEDWERLKRQYYEQIAIPALVFDPFVGSGTTIKVAHDLGQRGIGLDLSLEYLHKQARKRIHNGHIARLF